MTIDLTQIILAIITLLFGLLMRYVIPNVKSKTDENQMAIIRAAVKTAVYAVEQLYKSKPGQEKKALVIQYLKNNGFEFNDKEVKTTLSYLIEEAVKALNLEQNEHVETK